MRRTPSQQRLLNSLGPTYRPIAKKAIAAGWTLTISGRGHPKLTAPDGYAIPLPSSSSAPGTLRYIKVQLRKHGIEA